MGATLGQEAATTASYGVRLAGVLLAVVVTVMVSGCSGVDGKRYDISPIFPLSADKCERYNGDESGEGPLNSTCMVTKADCERAAKDWNDSMRESGVNDAVQFSCD